MINNDILKRALAWSNTPHGIRVAFETDIQAIKSPDIKEAFALEQKKALETPKFFRGSPRTHWYDPQSNCIHVILENIRNEQELDRILLQEILRRRGLAGLVGEKTFDKIAYDAIVAQDEQNRQSFLSYVSGNIRNQQDVIAAGKMFLKAKAEQRAKALSPKSQTNAEQVWFSLTKKFIKKNAPALFNFLSRRDPFWVAMKIREGITQYSFEQKTVAKAVSATESSVEDAIARQHVREVEGRSIDLGGHIVIGLPGQVFLSSAPWARSYPIVLPFSALYKEPDKNYTQRFVSSAYGIKKDKHPYSLLSLIHLKREMEQPVAVFKSIDRNSGQVLMLPSVGGRVGEETGNFCIPVSPKEINVTREQGLYTNEHSGKWVNYIHSVYPKKDVGVVCWLSLPGLTSYLEDDFEHKWLQPATKRIEAEFDRMFQRAGIKKPSAEDVREILKSVSADDYVDLRSKIARFQDSVLNEAGLPRVYSVYRDILESATKVVKEFENPKFISRQIEFQISNQTHLNMEPKNQLLSFIDAHPESLRRLAYLCAAKSPVFGRELPPINPTEYVVDMSMDDLKETIIEHYPRLSSEDKEMIRAEFPDLPQYMVLDRHSDSYRLATDMAMFMANNLNRVGIKTKVISETEAKEELEKEYLLSKDGVEARNFSVRDIMNLSYTWNGEEVSMRGFAEQFMSEIKQKDRTMEDAERIAKAFIAAVKEDPEKAGMKMLKAENMANAFRFKLPDGTVYTPEHPMASSPEYETQKGLWLIYERVLGEDTMREFIGLLSKNSPMSADERKRFSELESKVNGSSLMQDSLEVPASKVNENRVKDIRNLIQYFEGNEDYTWTEKALIVKGAMSFGYSEKKESDQTKVEIKNISDNNSVAVPVIGGEAAAVVEGLRKGFTGWKVYKQSDKEEDAVILNQDVAGTGWCTGGAVSTARSHLSGGDFHVYYEAGEPLIAIRTKDGRMAEPPRGAHEGQFCTSREEQIAFDYIRGDNRIVAGDDYIADIEDIRRIMSPNATPTDAFLMPDKRRYENGEYGGDTRTWGDAVERRIAELIPEDKEERWKLGLYYSSEIEEACRNGYVKAIKGEIYLTGSASLILPEGVTQVENIGLRTSASLILPEGVTKVGGISLSGSTSLTLPAGVTKVGDIILYDDVSLSLPVGVTQVGDIVLYNSASLSLPEGVTQLGVISLIDRSSLTLPKGLSQVESINLFDYTSLTLPEGVTKVGRIELCCSSSLTLPESVTQVGNIELSESTSLALLAGVTKVGDIGLSGSASLTLPKGITQVGNIFLNDSVFLTLPEGVTQVENICLRGSSSLTLPEGVTKVGHIGLSGSASLTLPEGVTQVGNIELSESTSLALPAGVTKVGHIDLSGSASLTLPEGVTQVGDIILYGSSSLTLSEGVTQVGKIELYGSSSLTLPEGVTEVGNIYLDSSSSLTLPEGVTGVGNIYLRGSSSLTLPKGIIQASGWLTLSPYSSLVFPDGFELHNDLIATKRYSPETINELLQEHGEQKERSFQFRLSDGTVYGYQLGDTIYLTPKGINPNTPIHEYAHIWAKVYERLHPEEWEALKQELKTFPLWNHIASSESYVFIKDENRLAGEVLATLVGNKGEELLVDTAKDVIESAFSKSVPDKEVQFAIQQFKDKLTNLAVKDVFNAEGMEHTGDVTLRVLKDFANGKGIKLNKDEVDKIAANYSIKDNSNTNDMEDNVYFDGQDEQYPIIEPMESTSAIISPDGKKRSRSKKHYEKDEFDKYYGDIIDGLLRASKRAEDLLKQAVEVNDEKRQQFSTASDAVSHARMELEAAEKERKSSSQSGSIASGAATLLWIGSLVGLLYGFGGLFLLASAALGAAKISNKISEKNSQRKIEQLNEKISSLKEKKEAADIAYKNSQMQKEKASLEKKRIDSTIKYNQREQKKRIKEQGTKPKIVKTPAETLAANASMWLVGRLNAVGIKTVLVSQDTAKKLLDENAVLSARVGKETLYGEDDVMRFRRMSDKERHNKGIYFANELHGSGPMPSMVKTVICNVFNGFETISPIYYNIEHIYGDAKLTGGDYDNLVSVKGRLLIEGEVSAKSLSEVTRKAIIDSGYGTASLYAPNLDKSSRRYEETPHDYDEAYFDRNASKTTLTANYEGSDTFAFHTSSGVVYGFQKNDTIYLTEDGIDANTPIHEYAHLWAEVARRTAPGEWSGIVEAMKTSPMWASVVNDPFYLNLNGDENRIASEVLARITGNNAEMLLTVAAEQFAEQSDMTDDDKIRNTVALMREGICQIIANNLFNGVQLREYDKVSLKVIMDMVDLKQIQHVGATEHVAASMRKDGEHQSTNDAFVEKVAIAEHNYLVSLPDSPFEQWESLSNEQKARYIREMREDLTPLYERFGEDAIVSGTISREDMLDCLLRNSYEKTVQEASEMGLSSPTYEEIKNDKTSPGAAFWHATDKNYERLADICLSASVSLREEKENPYIGVTKDGYRPNPIDISSVEMTPELTKTIEMLASVTYENTRRTYNLTMGRYDAFIRYSKDADKNVSWEEASEEVKKAFLEPSEEICKSIEASVGLKAFMAMNDADKDNVIKDVARSLHDLFVEELIDKGYHYDPESTNPEEWDMAPHSDETGARTDFKAYDAKESLRLIAAVDAKEAKEQLELNNEFMSSPAADYLVKKVSDAIVRTNGLSEEAPGNAVTLVSLAFSAYGTEGLLNPNASVPVIEINGLKGNPAFAGVDDTVLNALVDACHDIGYACLNAIGADPADYFPLKESINWNSVYGLPETDGARIVKNTLVQAVQYEAEISLGPFPSSIGHFKRQIEKVKADNTIISLIPRDEDKIRLMTSETLEYALRNAGFIKPNSNIYTIKQTEDGLRLAASYKKDEFMLTSAYLTHEGDGELSYAVAPTRFENIFDTELNDLESVLNAFEKNIEGMNVFELAGANKLAHEINEALNSLKETYRNVEKLEEMSDHFVKETMTKLDERLSLAITEYERFIGRGYRENNNLWDTITGNRFEPTIPLPEKEVVNEKVAAGKDVWKQISDAEFNSRQYNKYVEKELGHDHLLLPVNYRSLPVNDESQHGDFSVVETQGKYNIVDGQGRKLLDQDADKITVKDHPRQETTIERQQVNPYQEFIIERQGDSRTVNSDQLKEVSRKKVATETIVPTPAGGRHFTPKEIDSLCQGNVVYAEGIPYMFREGDGKGADLAHLPGAVYNESGKPTAISRELFEYFVAHPDKDLMVVSADALKEYGIGLQDGALKFNTLKEVVPMNEIAKNAISPLVRNALSNVNSSKTYCKADALHVKGVLEKFKPEVKKGPSRGVAHDPGKAQGAARKK